MLLNYSRVEYSVCNCACGFVTRIREMSKYQHMYSIEETNAESSSITLSGWSIKRSHSQISINHTARQSHGTYVVAGSEV